MSRYLKSLVGPLVVLFVLSVGFVQAADFGTLKGQIKYGGTPKVAEEIKPDKDVEVCGKNKIFREGLVVGKNGEVANVVILLKNKAGEKLTVDPAVEKDIPKTVQLDNNGCRFTPHIAFVTTGQTLSITNSDTCGHNSKLSPFINPEANPTIGSKDKFDVTLTQPENLPFKVACGIHPWMAGWVVVRDNPFAVVTGDDGKFEIKGIPAGEYDFVFWQEQGGYLKEVEIGGKKVTLDKGKLKQKIAAGANDLGEIKADAKNFEGK